MGVRYAVVIGVLGVFFLCSYSFAQQYSHGPRQTGATIFDELAMGKAVFLAKVDSNGCTGKRSFRVDVKKQEGVSPVAPHYVLTVMRTVPDECKAIIEDGPIIMWDLEKDLGIKGNYTYSVSNMVHSAIPFRSGDDEASLISILKKYFTVKKRESGRIDANEQPGVQQGGGPAPR